MENYSVWQDGHSRDRQNPPISPWDSGIHDFTWSQSLENNIWQDNFRDREQLNLPSSQPTSCWDPGKHSFSACELPCPNHPSSSSHLPLGTHFLGGRGTTSLQPQQDMPPETALPKTNKDMPKVKLPLAQYAARKKVRVHDFLCIHLPDVKIMQAPVVVNTVCAVVDTDTMPEVSQRFIGKWRSTSPRGEDRANADNDTCMLDIPTPLLPLPLSTAKNVNITCKVQAPVQRGGEDVSYSELALVERKLSSLPVSLPSSLGHASGMGRMQSDKGQYKDQREVEGTEKPPPTVELASTTCMVGSGPTIPPLLNLLSCFPLLPSATISSSLPVISPPPPLAVQKTTEDTSMKVCDNALPKIISILLAEASDD